jgi:hypothetical protein
MMLAKPLQCPAHKPKDDSGLTPGIETAVRAAVNTWRDQNVVNTPERKWLDAMLIEIDWLRDQVAGAA